MIAAGHTVYIGARDATRGREAADQLGAKFLQLDVTDDESVAAAAGRLTELDVLVNCAGAFEGMLKPEDATAGHMREIFDVNVFGVVRTIHAFLPVLRRSDTPVIVNVSSGLGSFGTVNNPERHESRFPLPVYASSKAAVGMLTVQYAKGLPGIRVNAVDPGFTATEMHGMSGDGIQTAEKGTDSIVRLASIGANGPTGTFSDRHGELPW
ncbi:SDR family NAD(P)-dependent oxidoreductase [Amycolatopsis sp. NPDC050768]|uniref:SDR family NAD(P)-dependent oxidoreductase n=1 Tax=Amycolatopsis sp. NPDC050768 TaxID=3154839 RepID=UPI0033E2DEF7